MADTGPLIEVEAIRSLIITLPGRTPFMLASDLANIYGLETERVTQAVKRNPRRFPKDFAFRLTREERQQLQRSVGVAENQEVSVDHRLHYDTLAFTREGANMLSAVLHTPTAVARSVQIMRAFSRLEEIASKPAPSIELMALELAALGREMRQAQGELQLIWHMVTRPVPPEPVTPAPERRPVPAARPASPTSKLAQDDEVRAFLDGLHGSDTVQAIWLAAVQQFGRARMPSLSTTYLYFARRREAEAQ